MTFSLEVFGCWDANMEKLDYWVDNGLGKYIHFLIRVAPALIKKHFYSKSTYTSNVAMIQFIFTKLKQNKITHFFGGEKFYVCRVVLIDHNVFEQKIGTPHLKKLSVHSRYQTTLLNDQTFGKIKTWS